MRRRATDDKENLRPDGISTLVVGAASAIAGAVGADGPRVSGDLSRAALADLPLGEGTKAG